LKVPNSGTTATVEKRIGDLHLRKQVVLCSKKESVEICSFCLEIASVWIRSGRQIMCASPQPESIVGSSMAHRHIRRVDWPSFIPRDFRFFTTHPHYSLCSGSIAGHPIVSFVWDNHIFINPSSLPSHRNVSSRDIRCCFPMQRSFPPRVLVRAFKADVSIYRSLVSRPLIILAHRRKTRLSCTKYVERQAIRAWKRMTGAAHRHQRASMMPNGFILVTSSPQRNVRVIAIDLDSLLFH